jgi:hypothetical protein
MSISPVFYGSPSANFFEAFITSAFAFAYGYGYIQALIDALVPRRGTYT